MGTPVPSLETVISSADTHYSCKHKDYRPTLGVADKVSATPKVTENKQDNPILLQMADVFYFFKLNRGK